MTLFWWFLIFERQVLLDASIILARGFSPRLILPPNGICAVPAGSIGSTQKGPFTIVSSLGRWQRFGWVKLYSMLFLYRLGVFVIFCCCGLRKLLGIQCDLWHVTSCLGSCVEACGPATLRLSALRCHWAVKPCKASPWQETDTTDTEPSTSWCSRLKSQAGHGRRLSVLTDIMVIMILHITYFTWLYTTRLRTCLYTLLFQMLMMWASSIGPIGNSNQQISSARLMRCSIVDWG